MPTTTIISTRVKAETPKRRNVRRGKRRNAETPK
jgi:hypothetical protein